MAENYDKTKYEETDYGLIVPIQNPAPSNSKTDDGVPVKQGWTFTQCDERWFNRHDPEFRMKALEALYIAVNPGNGIGVIDDHERLVKMINELAVALVGGVPEGWEEFT